MAAVERSGRLGVQKATRHPSLTCRVGPVNVHPLEVNDVEE